MIITSQLQILKYAPNQSRPSVITVKSALKLQPYPTRSNEVHYSQKADTLSRLSLVPYININRMADNSLDTRPTTRNHWEQQPAKAPAARQARTSRMPGSAHNHDEAPPGQPGPDFSARKPPFTRGPSVIDGTAITSAAPTPAGEISNPMNPSIVKVGSRQRESHLPDLDIQKPESTGSSTSQVRLEPRDETSGIDEFGPHTLRAETEAGSGGTTDNWQG